ncbi:hypothetical protein HF257_19790 [Pseudomonas sp. WS 5106]|uniref:MrkD-like receptor binding domain-containing protein n=1 Tax=Pseudomonas cremoris TaxID=2724178 RepID=A0A7X1APP1_9PSED|nr:hypothetical protein [Pseudomonas cremoris]MBC2381032.1 hypothetical protein [Pseudomonas cremoris]MBC2408260.1 hypothetical protein [Pseudomonas cremoris]
MAKKKAPKAPLLPPIFIPDMEPVFEGDTEGAAGGIGLRNVESPLVVYLINPKDGVGAGSIATLYWTNRNVPVASTPIREEDTDQALIPLTVPQHNVVEFWANPVYAKLRRSGGGNTSETEEIKVRVRLNRPGGDPGPGPGHKGLMYEIPPGVVLNGVSEAVAQAGVKITVRYWQYMRPYDLIRLVWGSRTVEHRVLPGEEGRDIVVNVDYETIKAAGNNPLTRVAYQVRDAGGNLPAEGARWSVSAWIDVHLSEVRPEAPWLAYPDTHPNRIDLSELGSWDVEVQIWVTSAETGAFSHVTLIWDGKDSEGNPIPHTAIKPLVGPGLYTFTVDNALVEAIADGTASVHALYQRAGGEQPSQKLYLDIFGQVIRWPAPKIREDLGGHLDPAFNATVYFPLQESWSKDGLIEVVFRVSSPDNSIEFRMGREVDDVAPTPAGELEFTVPETEVKRFEGHLVDVFYAFTRKGSHKPQESLRLQIVVGVLVRTMPVPIIAKAIAGQLNPDDITDYAKVFSTYTETLRSDWIRMFWIGRRARTEVPVQVAVSGTTTEHDIDKSYLTNNLNETVAVFYSLKRGTELPRYSQITELLISRTLSDLLAPTLLGADVTGPNTAELEPLKVQTGTQLVVTYTGMRDEDSIKVTVVGTSNGGSPDIPAKFGNQTVGMVEFDFTAQAIAANIRSQATTLKFHYVVTRAGTPKTSATLTVTVKPIPMAELAKTVIKLNEANATTKVLDLSTFTGNATAHVGIWPFIFNTRPVWLRFLGKTASNVTHDHLLFNGAGSSAVNSNWISTGKIEWPLPRTYLEELGNNTTLMVELKAAFSASKVEAEAVAFPLVQYTVNTIQMPVEFPVPKLTPATVTGATTATLAPLNAQAGGTVSVQFTPMYTTDKIKVTMVGTAGAGSPVIAEKNGLASGVQTFDIPKTAIAANIGNANKTFTLKYDVTRNGVTRASTVLTVTVTPIPQAELLKTVMQILQANQATKVLDLSTVTAGATTRVGVWPFITSTFPVWLKLTGQKNDGTAITPIVVWNGAGGAAVNPNWIAAGFLDGTIAYNSLKDLGHGKKLTMAFKAAMSTSKVEADAIVFPEVEYTIDSLPAQFPVPKLTPATVTGATTATMAPLDAQAGGTASVAFTPMYTTDKIKVTMVGTAGAGSPVIAEKNGLASGVQTFDIPKTAIAANIGNANKTFTLKYEVTRGGVTRPSATLTVTVTPIPVTELQKTVLRINQANQTTKILDLSAVTSGGTLHVGSWPFIAQSQPVAMVLSGFKENNAVHNRTVWTLPNNAVTAGWFNNGFYEELIPASYFSELGRNKTLSLLFKVSLNGTTVEANAITLTAVNYTIADTRPPSLSIAPTVNEADPYNNALSLLKPINGVTVVVPHYAGMWVGDDITLVWGGGSTGSQGEKVTSLGAQSISVPQSVITQSIGKTLNFSYNVKRDGGTVASPASPTLSIAVQNPILTGTVRFSSGTTSYYKVTPTSTQVSVPSGTPNNTVVAQTNQLAASAETRGTGTNWNMGNVNLIGPQPSTASNIFPTNVKGIGMRFVRYTIPTNSSDYFNGGGLGPNTNGEASNGVNPLQRRMHVEFIKVGPVTSGTIAAGYIMQRVAGSNRLHFLGVQLMSAITFTAT